MSISWTAGTVEYMHVVHSTDGQLALSSICMSCTTQMAPRPGSTLPPPPSGIAIAADPSASPSLPLAPEAAPPPPLPSPPDRCWGDGGAGPNGDSGAEEKGDARTGADSFVGMPIGQSVATSGAWPRAARVSTKSFVLENLQGCGLRETEECCSERMGADSLPGMPSGESAAVLGAWRSGAGSVATSAHNSSCKPVQVFFHAL